jgi:hypothetical protein
MASDSKLCITVVPSDTSVAVPIPSCLQGCYPCTDLTHTTFPEPTPVPTRRCRQGCEPVCTNLCHTTALEFLSSTPSRIPLKRLSSLHGVPPVPLMRDTDRHLDHPAPRRCRRGCPPPCTELTHTVAPEFESVVSIKSSGELEGVLVEPITSPSATDLHRSQLPYCRQGCSGPCTNLYHTSVPW